MNRINLLFKLLKEKNYDEIFNQYGRNTYNFFVDFKYASEDEKKLLAKNDYATYYKKYGSCREINKYLKKLKKEGKFIEIFSICGNKFDKYKYAIYKRDVKNETGNEIYSKVYTVKKIIAGSASTLLSLFLIFSGIEIPFNNIQSFYASHKYSYMVDEYNQKINRIANEIKQLNLNNDIEIAIKVYEYMILDIKGYLENENYDGLFNLAFTFENGYGVCRHFAKHFSAIMNAINPEYNAKTIAVFMDQSKYTMDTAAKIRIPDLRSINNNNNVTTQNGFEKTLEKISNSLFANHLVSTFTPIGADYSIVFDPTNSTFGIISNGEIKTFSTIDYEGLSYRPISQFLVSLDTHSIEVEAELLKSFIFHTSNEEFDELNEIWGHDAQNQTIDNIVDLENEKIKKLINK